MDSCKIKDYFAQFPLGKLIGAIHANQLQLIQFVWFIQDQAQNYFPSRNQNFRFVDRNLSDSLTKSLNLITDPVTPLMCILSAPSQKFESHPPKKCLIYLWLSSVKKKKEMGTCLEFSKTDVGVKEECGSSSSARQTIAAINDSAKNFQTKYIFREMISATARTACQSYLEEKISVSVPSNAPERWTGSTSRVINFRFALDAKAPRFVTDARSQRIINSFLSTRALMIALDDFFRRLHHWRGISFYVSDALLLRDGEITTLWKCTLFLFFCRFFCRAKDSFP